MAKTDARLLRKAHRESREALTQLVEPVRFPYGATTHLGPSLMTQLRLEMANSGNRGVARSRNAPIPINPDAYDLLDQIVKWAGASVSTVDARLRAIVAGVTLKTDLDAVVAITNALIGWANAIHALLDPLRRYHIAKPCPRCNNVMAWREMPNGERLQTHALVVDGTHGCECLACGALWPITHLEHLARVLGCDPLPGAVISDTVPV